MRRIIYVAGRSGSSLFAIGLALFLVYLIPSANFNSVNGLGTSVSPDRYVVPTSNSLSPTYGVHVEVQADGSFRFLLIAVDQQVIRNWTNTWACNNGGQPILFQDTLFVRDLTTIQLFKPT